MDDAAVSEFGELKDDVIGGESRADKENVVVAVDAFEHAFGPGDVNVAAAVEKFLRAAHGVFAGEVADGEDNAVGVDGASVFKINAGAGRTGIGNGRTGRGGGGGAGGEFFDVDRFAGDVLEDAVVFESLAGFGKEPADIIAVEAAGEKVVGADVFGIADAAGAFAGPVDEMIGSVGEGAHAGGGDVEAVTTIVGAVGHAATHGRVSLDQRDACAGRSLAHELHCDERPGKAAADDGDAWCGHG